MSDKSKLTNEKNIALDIYEKYIEQHPEIIGLSPDVREQTMLLLGDAVLYGVWMALNLSRSLDPADLSSLYKNVVDLASDTTDLKSKISELCGIK